MNKCVNCKRTCKNWQNSKKCIHHDKDRYHGSNRDILKKSRFDEFAEIFRNDVRNRPK